jgi:hypothetical protein
LDKPSSSDGYSSSDEFLASYFLCTSIRQTAKTCSPDETTYQSGRTSRANLTCLHHPSTFNSHLSTFISFKTIFRLPSS